VPLLAVETHGANSFQQSVLAGELVTLPKITSIATTLGAKRVSAKSLELSMVHPVAPFGVSDAMASSACWQFLGMLEHKLKILFTVIFLKSKSYLLIHIIYAFFFNR
jgi:threonine dehydratase